MYILTPKSNIVSYLHIVLYKLTHFYVFQYNCNTCLIQFETKVLFVWDNAIWRISKCANWVKIISKYDTFIDFGVKIDIFGFCCFWQFFHLKTFLSKTAFVSDKVPSAKWPHKPADNIMLLVKTGLYNWICYQNLDVHPLAPFCVFSI